MTETRSRGRPKLVNGRHSRLGIRLTEAFVWEVRAAAAHARMGLSEYIELALKNQIARDQQADQQYVSVMTQDSLVDGRVGIS